MRLIFNYPLTKEEKLGMYEYQRGLCAFCNKPLDPLFKFRDADVVADHDHENGLVRGLVHNLCNSLIGSHNLETCELLHKYLSIDYLDRWEEMATRTIEKRI